MQKFSVSENELGFTDLDRLNFGYSGLVLGSSQFAILTQLPQKMTLTLKVIKNDSKIIILICLPKSEALHTILNTLYHYIIQNNVILIIYFIGSRTRKFIFHLFSMFDDFLLIIINIFLRLELDLEIQK